SLALTGVAAPVQVWLTVHSRTGERVPANFITSRTGLAEVLITVRCVERGEAVEVVELEARLGEEEDIAIRAVWIRHYLGHAVNGNEGNHLSADLNILLKGELTERLDFLA